MKVVKLRFDVGGEKVTSSADPNVHRARTPDDIVVGDMCRYLFDGQLVVAEVIEINDINFDKTDATPAPSSVNQTIIEEIAKLRETIKNDVISEIQKSFVQNSFTSEVDISSENVSPCTQTSGTPEILELLFPEDENLEPPAKKHCRMSTPISMVRDENESSDEEYNYSSMNRKISRRSPGYKSRNSVLTDFMPVAAQLRVENSDGCYVPVFDMDYDDLVNLFDAKWKHVNMPPIAEQLNMPLAVHHLRKPCIDAFNNTDPRSFMYPIACYLFDMDVLRTAFLPAPRCALLKKSGRPSINKKRRLNSKAQKAFFFLVDYFSTILMDPTDPDHPSWLFVIRNRFNKHVTELIREEQFGPDGLPKPSTNKFLSYVFPDHVPIFNCDTAF